MLFNNFLDIVKELKSIPLGGQTAQFKLAPAMRLKYDDQKINAKNPIKAAVLALFYPNNSKETTLLLTERASYSGTHSAQIRFPGGKIEANDASLKETALRETYEEVGIEKNEISIIREITDVYIPPSNFLATPFLGYTNHKPVFTTNHEVASTLEILVSDILNDNNIKTVTMNTSYMKNVAVPCFQLNNHIVWEATGMMLSEIKELIKAVSLG